MFFNFSKRTFDIFFALAALIILSFPMLIISILVYKKIDKQILFRQIRVGKNERKFLIYKFKTMSDERDSNGKLLPDEIRMPRFGKLIRKLSLDELPQLINILKGDMSFIGPRPLLESYLLLYTEEQRIRHDVLPGLTGWAQINGRNNITWEEKFALDIYYIKNRSMYLDMKILVRTIFQVLLCKDISRYGHATTTEFLGGESK